MDTTQPAYIDSKEMQARTGIAESTWRDWARRGIGPKSIRVGRRRLWKWIEAEQWLDAQNA